MTQTKRNLHEDKLFSLIIIIFLLSVYFAILGTSFAGLFGILSFNNFGLLTIPSVLVFVSVCILSLYKRKMFFLFLIPVLLAFPSPVDDIFPSVVLSNPDDAYRVVFPLITRVDIFLLMGIIVGLVRSKFKIPLFRFSLIIKIFLFLFLFVFVSNLIKSNDLQDFNLFIAYSFHIRYFILFILLLNIYDIHNYEREIVYGFILSIAFLLIEAYINTYVKGYDRLSSGSLSLNTFANITASILVYVIYLFKNKKINMIITLISLIIGGVILIGSGTRGAILSLFVSIFLIDLIGNPRKAGQKLLIVGVLGVSMVFLYVRASQKKMIPDRYSYTYISKRIKFDFSKNNLTEIVQIKRSYETNSIISRLNLFESSINMIKENPISGIGVGRWNRYKNTYSSKRSIDKVLLDSHNDYLAITSQYGIILGMLICYLVFIYPIKSFRLKRDKINGLDLLFVISFTMGVAALSNSGFFKHQISAILLFCLCVSHQTVRRNKIKEYD